MPLLQDLTLLNPWWEAGLRAWPVPTAFRRHLYEPLVRNLRAAEGVPHVLLVGFRRVGKTVLAQQALRSFHDDLQVPLRNLVYADFQESLLTGVGPMDVLEATLPRRVEDQPFLAVFDEIQFVSEWDKELRHVIRRWQDAGVIVLASGSGAGDLRRASGDVLLDRIRLMRLGPMTFHEWVDMSGTSAASPEPERQRAFSRYLVRGGFPDLAGMESTVEIQRRLRELCEQYVIDGDLVRRLKIRNVDLFGKLWLHFVHNPGAILDWSRLPGEFGVARETLESWITALRQAEIIAELLPSKPSGEPLFGRKRYSRVYPIDHALCGAYGVPVEEGPGLETLVFRHLRDLRERIGIGAHLTYWRSDGATGSDEIDFRLTGPDLSLLFEVKGSARVAQSQVRKVAHVAARLGVRDAILVYTGASFDVVDQEAAGRKVRIRQWPAPDFLLATSTTSPSCEGLLR